MGVRYGKPLCKQKRGAASLKRISAGTGLELCIPMGNRVTTGDHRGSYYDELLDDERPCGRLDYRLLVRHHIGQHLRYSRVCGGRM
jgi:hypothetical protein